MYRVVTVEFERAGWYRHEYLLDAVSSPAAQDKIKKIDVENIYILSIERFAICGRTLGRMPDVPDWVLAAYRNAHDDIFTYRDNVHKGLTE